MLIVDTSSQLVVKAGGGVLQQNPHSPELCKVIFISSLGLKRPLEACPKSICFCALSAITCTIPHHRHRNYIPFCRVENRLSCNNQVVKLVYLECFSHWLLYCVHVFFFPSYGNVLEVIDFHHVLAVLTGSVKDFKSSSPESEFKPAFTKPQKSFQQVTACLSKESSCYRYWLSVPTWCGDSVCVEAPSPRRQWDCIARWGRICRRPM